MSGESGVDPSWYGFHIHYHADLDRLLADFVRPLLDKLVADLRIDRFFFVRYSLGGPHLRLRLHPLPAQTDATRDQVMAAVAEFFHRWPSPKSQPTETTLRINASILSTDPAEHDPAVYPDNFVRECPFRPETERYGGAARFPSSLDYFVLSSARALRFVTLHRDTPRARQLPLILRMLLGEAVGFAQDGEALLALLASRFEGHPDAMKVFVERGDRLFAEQKELFCRLVRSDIEAISAGSPPLGALGLADAARDLAAALRSAPPTVKLGVAGSQLHMSANRLGLSNPEEVYLGRVLWLAAEELRSQDPSLWQRLTASQ